MNNLEKTILITGASKGMGLSTAKKFLKDPNFRLILVSRESDSFKNTIDILRKNYTNEIIVFYADLSKSLSVDKLLKKIIKLKYNIDIIVNNAGYTNPVGFLDSTAKDFRHTLEVNLISPYKIIKELFKAGKHAKKIINIASTSGIGARPGWLSYACSKSAMISMSDTLREELSVFNVDVICLSPGRCATDLRKTLAPHEDPTSIMQPEDVADTIYYLASDSGKFLTSQNLIVRQ